MGERRRRRRREKKREEEEGPQEKQNKEKTKQNNNNNKGATGKGGHGQVDRYPHNTHKGQKVHETETRRTTATRTGWKRQAVTPRRHR